MKNKECKIVQDILPNYIDKLTSQETNEFIENHLKECTECTEMLNNMKKEINSEDTKKQKKVINFIKKYNKKITILKFILLTILVIFILVLGRRTTIMLQMSNKAKESKKIDNYFVSYNLYDAGSVTTIYSYVKEDNFLRELIYSNNYDSIYKITEYCNGNNSNYYIENSDSEKIAMLNSEKEVILTIKIEDYCFLEKDSSIKTFLRNVFMSSVKTVKCNDKECYYFSNIVSSSLGMGEIYVDKETGLIVRAIINGTGVQSTISDFTYNFNTINDESLKEPDISEYKIVSD